jgi:hypothetical protein
MLGWIGWAWCFYGTWLIGRKDKSGFVVSLVGELWLIAHGLCIRDYSLVVAAVAWGGLLAYNYRKWSDDERIQETDQAGDSVDHS